MKFCAMWYKSKQVLCDIERIMNDTPRPTSDQNQTMEFKRRDFTPLIGRNPPSKKGKSGSSFGALPRKIRSFVHGGSSGGGASVGGQTHQGETITGRSMEQRGPVYLICMRCNQKHTGNCSAISRCYICRGEGH